MNHQYQNPAWFCQCKLLACHALCLLIPLYALAFVYYGPYSSGVALCWVLPAWLTVLVDRYGPKQQRDPGVRFSTTLYDWTLYLLAGLQLVNLTLMLAMTAQLSVSSWAHLPVLMAHLFAIKIIIGTSSSFSGVLVAHELLHRRQCRQQLLGRVLLTLVCYEHFATEHIRGHHRYVCTTADPATARLGESFRSYWRRSVPEQFRHAWQLEQQRLSCPSFRQWRILQNHVLQGVLFQCALIVLIAGLWGCIAVLAFILQAYAAVQKLEAANYFEHWGLSRTVGQVGIVAWETDSCFTRYTLVGLSLHTDHHKHARKPYQCLAYDPGSPQLPGGYYCMAFMVVFRNAHFQALARQELRRWQDGAGCL